MDLTSALKFDPVDEPANLSVEAADRNVKSWAIACETAVVLSNDGDINKKDILKTQSLKMLWR